MMFNLLTNGGTTAPAYKINYILTQMLVARRKAPLIRMPIVWADDGLNIPQNQF